MLDIMEQQCKRNAQIAMAHTGIWGFTSWELGLECGQGAVKS